MLLGAVSSTAFTTAHAADVVLPTGTIKSVSSGTVTSASSGTQTTVTQTSNRAIINWSDLSVASGDTLEFVQPSSSSVTLNRVVRLTDGPAIVPTNINGELKANGQVWILNPTGVLVGSTGQVNVAGFLATTLDIADADFNAATDVFNFSGDSTASIINQGSITTSGYAVLAGHRVENSGLVQAQLGTVALGSGRAMSLTFAADKLISFVVSDPAIAQDSGIINASTGQLIADGGRVLMTAPIVCL
jgi:filamentous hemagglutinin family protein